MAIVRRGLTWWLLKVTGRAAFADVRSGRLPSLRRARRRVLVAAAVTGAVTLCGGLLAIALLAALFRALT